MLGPAATKTARAGAPSAAIGPWAALIGLVVLLGTALAARWPRMTESLWYDEVWRTDVVLRGPMSSFALWRDVHNPLYNSLMYLWTGIFGDSEVSVRLPSLLAGMVVVIVVARWAACRLGRGAGLMTAALLLFSPPHIWFSTEAKNNMFVTILSVLAVVGLDAALRSGRRRDGVVAGVWAALALYVSWQAALLLLPLWAAAGVLAVRRPGIGPDAVHARAGGATGTLAACVAACGLLVAPLLVFKAGQLSTMGREYATAFDLYQLARMLAVWLPTGNAMVNSGGPGGAAWVAALGVAPLAALAIGAGVLRRSASGVLVMAGLLGPMLALLAGTALVGAITGTAPEWFTPRNLLVCLPWFAVAVAAGVSRPSVAARAPAAAVLALGVVACVGMHTWRAGYAAAGPSRPDWRSIAARIDAIESEGRSLVISGSPLLPMEYYARSGPELLELPPAGVAAGAAAMRAEADGSRAVIVINNPRWDGVPRRRLGELEAALGPAERIDVGFVQLYVLGPRAPAAQH